MGNMKFIINCRKMYRWMTPVEILIRRKKPQCINCVYFERQPPTQQTFEIPLRHAATIFPLQRIYPRGVKETSAAFQSEIFKKTGISYNYRCRVNNWQQFNQKDLETKPENLKNVKQKRKCSSFIYYEKEFDQDPDYISRIEVIRQEKNDKRNMKIQMRTLVIASFTLIVGLFPLISIYHFFKDAYNLRMKNIHFLIPFYKKMYHPTHRQIIMLKKHK